MVEYTAVTSEGVVIGALMNDVKLILALKELKPDFFTHPAYKILYLTIRKLFRDGSTEIDILDVSWNQVRSILRLLKMKVA